MGKIRKTLLFLVGIMSITCEATVKAIQEATLYLEEQEKVSHRRFTQQHKGTQSINPQG